MGVEVWIILAVSGNLVLSGASLLDKEILRRLSPVSFLVISEMVWVPIIFCALLFSPLFPFLRGLFGDGLALVFPGGRLLLLALSPGWVATIALFFYYRAMSILAPSRLLMIALIGSSLTAAIISMVLRWKFFTLSECIAFILLLGGGWFASLLLYKNEEKKSIASVSGVRDIIIGSIGFGIHAVLLNRSGNQLPWFSAFFWQGVAGVSVMCVFFLWMFRDTFLELAEVFRSSSDIQEKPKRRRSALLFVLNKVCGFSGIFVLSFAKILGNSAFVPAFEGVKYVTVFCYEHFREGHGFWGRFRLLFTFRMLFMFIAAALMALGILILAFHAPKGGAQ